MKIIRSYIAGCIILGTFGNSFAQTIEFPNYALKSHETLDITKIEMTDKASVFHLRIENRIHGGSFCADRNIYIVYPDGSRSMLKSSEGIPVCPDSYMFRLPGEKLEFTLTFPPLTKETQWLDLIEDCSDNCFLFLGIVLDPALNKKVDAAFTLAEEGEAEKALAGFIGLTEEIDNQNHGIEGSLYINIIRLARETGNDKKAGEWYIKFTESGSPHLDTFIRYLNDFGIRY